MIPHLIDLICRGVSLAVLVWGVFSMGFSSAERKAATVRAERADQYQVERPLQPSPGLRLASRARSARGDRGLHPRT